MRDQVLKALAKTKWMSFVELSKKLGGPHRPNSPRNLSMRLTLRDLVGEKTVEVRIRPKVGTGRGRGPDEFRKTQ